MTAMVSPVAIAPPSETPSSWTLPPTGAVISFSIFIASITQISAPSSTSAPFSTATRSTVPWIGDTSSPAAPPPPAPPRDLDRVVALDLLRLLVTLGGLLGRRRGRHLLEPRLVAHQVAAGLTVSP